MQGILGHTLYPSIWEAQARDWLASVQKGFQDSQDYTERPYLYPGLQTQFIFSWTSIILYTSIMFAFHQPTQYHVKQKSI